MSRDQLKRLKELETENTRLRRAVSDLTLDKMILSEAARDEGRLENYPVDGFQPRTRQSFQALAAAVDVSTMYGKPLAYQSAGSAADWGSIARRSARCPSACRTKNG